MKGKRKRRRRGWSAGYRRNGRLRAEFREDDVIRLCGAVGLAVRWNQTVSGHHVMFLFRDQRVLDYWPSNGTIWSPIDNQKAKVSSVEEAVNAAVMVAKRRFSL